MNCVDWNQATAYCAFVKKRLPTEEEWEFAVRGPEGRRFPWGNEDPKADQACWKSDVGTCPVGRFASGASRDGVLDLAGNVDEWTSSVYSLPGVKPAAVTYVSRGGSWSAGHPLAVAAILRGSNAPTARDGHLGFRCARTP